MVFQRPCGCVTIALADKRNKDARETMAKLDIAAFNATELVQEPFPYLIVPGFLKAEARAAVQEDYPEIANPGSFPTSEVEGGPAFTALLDELEGPELRAAFEAKFGIDLSDLFNPGNDYEVDPVTGAGPAIAIAAPAAINITANTTGVKSISLLESLVMDRFLIGFLFFAL